MRTESSRALCIAILCFGLAFCSSAPKEKAIDDESNPEYQFKKANVALNYGLPEQAVQYIERTLELDPEHYQALNLLGIVYLKLEDIPAAVSAFERCVEIKPDFADGHYNLATVYEKLNRIDDAVSAYRRSLDVGDPKDARISLSKLLFNQGKLEEALDIIEKSEEESVSVFNLKGVILNKMERYDEAIRAFDRAIQISPKDIVTRMNLGIALVNSGNYERARKVFEYILPYVEDKVLKDRITQYLDLIKKR